MKQQSQLLQEGLNTLSQVGTSGCLGVKRWDEVVDDIPESGVVSIPVQVGAAKFSGPFYYVIERLGKEAMLYCKPLSGGEPYRLGDVCGFFGISHLNEFNVGDPIILVEGIADWRAVRLFYPNVLATFTAGISYRQLFFLKNLTGHVLLAFDRDEAGARASKMSVNKLSRIGIRAKTLQPPQKDWGEMLESDWGMQLLEQTEKRVTQILESWF